MNLTDQQLLARLRQGDRDALRVLFDQYYPYLISVVLKLSGDLELSKDIAQEVFLEIWKRREKLEIEIALKPYLRRAGINRMLNKLKSNRLDFREHEDLPEEADQASDPQHLLEASDLQQAIQQAIDLLPPKCRLIFTLKRIEGMSHDEIAEELQISKKTIENQMTKALKMIRASLIKAGHKNKLLTVILVFMEYIWIIFECYIGDTLI